MNKKQNNAREQLERLCNTLADDIDAMSDDELLAELKEAGEDADAIAARTGALIADAVAIVGRRKLAAARAGYAAHKAGHRSNVLQWPVERKRALIQHFAQNDNALKQKLTLAARKGGDTEADVDSFIEDLIDLGVIDDEGNAT
jgi:cell division FtsZ-interacting protein ZapD